MSTVPDAPNPTPEETPGAPLCRARAIEGIPEFADCLVPNARCPHVRFFGSFRFCRHPQCGLIAELTRKHGHAGAAAALLRNRP